MVVAQQQQPAPEDYERACWVCLGGEEEGVLETPCRCPADRAVHLRCLARWQLQSAGRSEEKVCRFCQAPYPDWKQTLTPANLKPAIPVVSVQYNGTCYRLRVKPGPKGLANFQRQLQGITGLPALDCLQITFQCRAPDGAQELNLRGISAFDAAIHCASISAAERLSSAASASSASFAPAGPHEGQGQPLATRASDRHSIPSALSTGPLAEPQEQSEPQQGVDLPPSLYGRALRTLSEPRLPQQQSASGAADHQQQPSTVAEPSSEEGRSSLSAQQAARSASAAGGGQVQQVGAGGGAEEQEEEEAEEGEEDEEEEDEFERVLQRQLALMHEQRAAQQQQQQRRQEHRAQEHHYPSPHQYQHLAAPPAPAPAAAAQPPRSSGPLPGRSLASRDPSFHSVMSHEEAAVAAAATAASGAERGAEATAARPHGKPCRLASRLRGFLRDLFVGRS